MGRITRGGSGDAGERDDLGGRDCPHFPLPLLGVLGVLGDSDPAGGWISVPLMLVSLPRSLRGTNVTETPWKRKPAVLQARNRGVC